MKLIMARRIDPRSGWQAELYKDEPRSVQLEIRDNGELHTRWGPVIEQRIEGSKCYMTERSRTNGRAEDFIIPLAEWERLQAAADWQRLADQRPTAYWRKLSREGYATLALRPDPAGQLRGDYNLLTMYQCVHWFDDSSCLTNFKEFVSGEGNEGAFDQASTWSQQVEHGELLPLARLQFVGVPLAVGMTVRIVDGGLNNRPVKLGDQPRNLTGKEAVVVEEWQRGRSWDVDARTGEWKPDGGHWYVECEGERLNFSLKGGQEISASYYVLAEKDTSPNLDTQGQVVREQQYHVADHYALHQRLDHLAQQADHSIIQFPSAADLAAWLPTYRVIDRPQPRPDEGLAQRNG